MKRLVVFTVCVLAMSQSLAAQQAVVSLAGEGFATQRMMLAPEEMAGYCSEPGELLGEWFYPVVGHVQGLNGTFFKTDFSIANFRNASQDYLLQFLPQGVSGLGQPAERHTIAPYTISSISDILGPSGLNVNGVGSILVTGVLSNSNTIDTSSMLAGSVRTYTPQANFPIGTNGFSYQGFSPRVLPPTTTATVFGVIQSLDFRTNGALANLDPMPHTFTVTALGVGVPPFQWQETVPPYSMLQFPVPPTFLPGGTNYFAMIAQPVPPLGNSFPWTFSAASVDNHTGDAFFVSARYSY